MFCLIVPLSATAKSGTNPTSPPIPNPTVETLRKDAHLVMVVEVVVLVVVAVV